jgi:predicted esterase
LLQFIRESNQNKEQFMLRKKDTVVVTPEAAAEKLALRFRNKLVGRVTLARIFLLLMLWPKLVSAATPPIIQPPISLQHQAVALGDNATFTMNAVGDRPLAFQWKLAATDLAGCTNNTLAITNAKPSDEGDYMLLITNAYGAITSAPARLYVVPPGTAMVKGNYTTGAALRLPYFYHLPAGYNPARRYPLVVLMHGTPTDESTMMTFFDSYPATRVFASYNQETTDPVILVWPSRRTGDSSWTDPYLQQVSGLIDKLIADFSIDTNRVYILGGSEGVHAAWDLAGMRPAFFASVCLTAGWSGAAQPQLIKDVPIWVWCASDDTQVGVTRGLVQALRSVGGKIIYTEFNSGGHLEGIFMGMRTPVVVDWILAQRRGNPCTNEPLLKITSPTSDPTFVTGSSPVSLAGTAGALGHPVTNVTWINSTRSRAGQGHGTYAWSADDIELTANRTNIVLVTAATTSWSAGYGGKTTFNDSLAVWYSPLVVNLSLQGRELILNWSGGVAPFAFDIERRPNLDTNSHWTIVRTNATPPVVLPQQSEAEFFRVVTH